MAQVNNEEKIIYARDKDEIFDLAPDKITPFTGDTLIGGVSQGTIAENARPDITRPFQSPNFKSGTRGWRLNSNGKSQLNDPE